MKSNKAEKQVKLKKKWNQAEIKTDPPGIMTLPIPFYLLEILLLKHSDLMNFATSSASHCAYSNRTL